MSPTERPFPERYLHPELIAARKRILPRLEGECIDTAVVLGSGLSALAPTLLKNTEVFLFEEIPGFPNVAPVEGHVGQLHIGTIGCHRVAMFLGRNHLYQGLVPRDVVFPVRLAHALGAQEIVLTNAAGSLDPEAIPGELLLIADHINMTGASPIDVIDPIHRGSPFISMARAYSPRLRTEALWAARSLGIELHEGVYVGVRGPQYETPSEAAYYHSIGGHAVGMSTVLETIAARILGMKVLGLSLLTNRAGTKENHSNVLTAAAEARDVLGRLLGTYLHHEELEPDIED